MRPDEDVKAALPKTEVDPRTLDLCKALSHGLRVRVLTFLTERGEPVSPVEMSRILPASVGDISHHCKQLVKYGCAEEVSTRQRRGATEHFYRSTKPPVLTKEDWAQLAAPVKDALSRVAWKMIVADGAEAIEAGTMDSRDERFLARLPMELDEEGWVEMHDAWLAALDTAAEVQARSDERRKDSGEDSIKVAASLMFFELPQTSA